MNVLDLTIHRPPLQSFFGYGFSDGASIVRCSAGPFAVRVACLEMIKEDTDNSNFFGAFDLVFHLFTGAVGFICDEK